MRYKPEYDEYSETNKFLDELFREDCEFGWGTETPSENGTLSITVLGNDDEEDSSAEKEYLRSLGNDIVEKITSIIDDVDKLPDEKDRGVYMNKEDLISRLISISNSLDGIKSEMDESSGSTIKTTIIGGGCPISSMF